jgi:hypothetical protein
MNTTALIILAVPLLCLGFGCIALALWASRTITDTYRKKEAWPAFAQAIGGQFTAAKTGKPDQVKSMVGDWPVYLDTHVVGNGRLLIEYTRLRAFYLPRKAFEAIIFTEGATDELRATPGLFETPAVVLDLRQDLTAKTNDVEMLRMLLADENLSSLVQVITPLHLEIRRRRNWQGSGVSNSVCEVYVQERGIVTDLERLKMLHALIVACLQQMRQIGAASQSFSDVR